MKYSFFSVAFTAVKAGGRTRDTVVMRRAEALVRNGLLILLCSFLISSTAYADAPTPTPPPAARESEIQRGYSFCSGGSFRSELHCARAAEDEHKHNPSKPFLFGVYYKIWEQTERSLEAMRAARSKDLDTMAALRELSEKYLGLARELREEMGLGIFDCWQFSLEEPCGPFSSPTPPPEGSGR
jgi:hypothetical protein